MSQRQRLYRLGVRRFFRLPEGVSTLGDCGAFNYANEPTPPYSVDEVLDFYEHCGFDEGVSIDHIILGFQRDSSEPPKQDWIIRKRISLEYAESFIRASERRGSAITPVGAAQGWNRASYADSVRRLQDMGYQRIALGGMVPLKTPDILDCLCAIQEIRSPSTELHLLGITRIDSMETFAQLGVTSFDSTSAFRQAFMDDRDNFHTADMKYAAVRVPQVDANLKLKRAILAGHISQRKALDAERNALRSLRAFDSGSATLEQALESVLEYESLIGVAKSYATQYRRTLEAAPWKDCPCGLCEQHGIEMIIFRGTERNKRRGFHNLAVLASRMARLEQDETR